MDQNSYLKGGVIPFLLCIVLLLSGCESLSYYWQASSGQMQLKRDQQDVSHLIETQDTDPVLRQQLLKTREILEFAERQLQLPHNGSYQTYVDTGRPFVVWNLFVTEEFSIKPYQWCYPVVGCLNYRGYFDITDAKAAQDMYRKRGYDTWMAGVRAYSTLGWFNDPLLNTFIKDSELQLAELIFHELAHQQVFAQGDTEFNESLATVVAQHGIQLWAQHKALDYDPIQTTQDLRQRREFAALIDRYRQKLADVYSTPQSNDEFRAKKAALFEQLRTSYAAKRRNQWQTFDTFDGWIEAPLNNAKMGTVASYYRWVENLQRLLEQHNGDLPTLYKDLNRLAELDRIERQHALMRL